MKILLNKHDLNQAVGDVSNLGFVPTMGGLHDGHKFLIKKSKKRCKKTLVSIFINPTQFNSKSDFNKYPRNINKDLIFLKRLKIDFLYLPTTNDLYKIKRRDKIRLNYNEKILCAKYRKGHFEGVIDVMDRLTQLIKPKEIFMGKKDYQQFFLVKKFIEKKFDSVVILCKTIRDKNKLALSTRNSLLKKNEIIIANKITNNLIKFWKNIKRNNKVSTLLKEKKNELIKLYNIKIEYLEIRNQKNLKKINNIDNKSILLIAYFIGDVRLIDNFC